MAVSPIKNWGRILNCAFSVMVLSSRVNLSRTVTARLVVGQRMHRIRVPDHCTHRRQVFIQLLHNLSHHLVSRCESKGSGVNSWSWNQHFKDGQLLFMRIAM